MKRGDLVFMSHELTREEKIDICDEAIYFIGELLKETASEVDLTNIAHRFKIDSLQSKIKALKKQI